MSTDDVPWATRLTGAVLAVGVAVAHIADQGGVTKFSDTADWIGWAYRLTEVGGVATAVLLLVAGAWKLAWTPAVVLGLGPSVSFLLSRTTGLPGDSGDKGSWMWGVGTLSLFVELALLIISLGVLLSRPAEVATTALPSRNPEPVH